MVLTSLADKLEITQELADWNSLPGGGWPGSNPKDNEYFERVRALDLQNIQVGPLVLPIVPARFLKRISFFKS